MDHFSFKRLRNELGLSLEGMSYLLGMDEEAQATSTLAQMEAGDLDIPGPVAALARHYGASLDSALPKFSIGEPLGETLTGAELANGIVMHNRYPRFAAFVVDTAKLTKDMQGIKVDKLESLCLGVVLDEVPAEMVSKLDELMLDAAKALKIYNEQADAGFEMGV